MLKRIRCIQNIGRFESCKPPGCQFGKETIIYGCNTQGKSTLTAILRSLSTGNNDILVGRKTFGATTPKKIELDFETKGTRESFVFQNRTWNKNNPGILIFDSRFITRNICDGESVSFEQQQNLNTVIIGENGHALKKAISDLQKLCDENTTAKTTKNREFNSSFPNIEYAFFKGISLEDDITEQIQAKEQEISHLKNKESIIQALNTHKRNIEGIPFTIKVSLEKTMESKQTEIEEHIRLHFSKSDQANNFLNDGLKFLKTSPEGVQRFCVFCGQALNSDAENLISIYSEFFKGGYRELQAEITHCISQFKRTNVQSIFSNLASDIEEKQLRIEFNQNDVITLTQLQRDFENELEKKKDLNYLINFTSFDAFQIESAKVLEHLNRLLEELNTPSTKSIDDLTKEKKQLEITRDRHSEQWVRFCEEMDEIDKLGDQYRSEREKKRKELESYSRDIFDQHKDSINCYCREMGADFEIIDFQPIKKIVGKDERLFALKFFGGHKINLQDTDDGKPNFQNALSESDKRLLAFAFFLSTLSHDQQLDQKIVVLDDPMSSFDSERKRKTAHLIADIACVYKSPSGTDIKVLPLQKILLSHEDRFIKEICRIIPNAETLKIVETVINGNKRSDIAHLKVAEEFPDDDIAQRIETIRSILDNRRFEESFDDDCRVVLDHIFKRKYYLYLKIDIADRKGVRTFSKTLTNLKVGGFDDVNKANRFDRLCDDLNIELHGVETNRSIGDKESILKDFFDCLSTI